MIIITGPIIGGVSCTCPGVLDPINLSFCVSLADVLYKRLILGEPRRTLPPRDDPEQAHKRLVPIKPEDDRITSSHS